jgi:hypothetical protein
MWHGHLRVTSKSAIIAIAICAWSWCVVLDTSMVMSPFRTYHISAIKKVDTMSLLHDVLKPEFVECLSS